MISDGPMNISWTLDLILHIDANPRWFSMIILNVVGSEIIITRASNSVCQSVPRWIRYKFASARLRWMLLKGRTCSLCFPPLYPFHSKIAVLALYKSYATSNFQWENMLTWQMTYSQSRLSPSKRYWSAALKTSCAISVVGMLTEPVYMYLTL